MARNNIAGGTNGRIITIAAAITLAAGAALSIGVTSASAGPDHARHAQTPAQEKAVVGRPAPDFTLTDLNGAEFTLSEALAEEGVNAVVIEWFNPDCPFVQKHHKHNQTMARLAAQFEERGVRWIAINSAAEGAQGAGIKRNKSAATECGIRYPILLDTYGEVGKLYEARTTPQMFVIDGDGVLVYSGAIDDNESMRKLGEVNYVEAALTATLAGKAVETPVTKPYGCSVKY